MTLKTSAGLLVALLAAQSQLTPCAWANSIRYDFLQGGTTVVGGNPLVTAIFEDVAPNRVNLTITAPGLSGNSFLRALYFNIDPTVGASALSLSVLDSSASGGVQVGAASADDSFKTGGGGKFDVKITFGSAPVFASGNSLTYSITSLTDLSADSFVFQDTFAAGTIQTYAAASIQLPDTLIILNSDPTSAVPDAGSTAWLLALALLPLGLLWRKSAVLPPPVPARA